MDGDKSVDVYEHSFYGGLIATLTRFKDIESEKKAWNDFMSFHSERGVEFGSVLSEHIRALDIQKDLYFGNDFKRKYNQFKYKSAKYDYAKI